MVHTVRVVWNSGIFCKVEYYMKNYKNYRVIPPEGVTENPAATPVEGYRNRRQAAAYPAVTRFQSSFAPPGGFEGRGSLPPF